MDQNTVIYSKNVGGEQYDVTVAHVLQSDAVHLRTLAHGIHRIANSARTNAEDKDSAEAARLLQIINGEVWQTGGGNAMDPETRLYRDHLAAWSVAHMQLKQTEASKRASKDAEALLNETAKAILKRKGESTSRDRVTEGAENLRKRIMKDVQAALAMTDVDI